MLTQDKILSSIKYVVDNSSHVSINQNKLEEYIRNFTSTKRLHWSNIYPLGYKRRIKDEDELDFLFLIDSQAFCFWGYPQKWTVNYKEVSLDGWWALIACFERAIEKGVPVLDGKYLSNLTLIDAKELFSGEPEIPLLKERKEILNKIGKSLVKKYQGRFHNFFKAADKDVFKFIEKLDQEFAGFNDVVTYKDKKVYFYKKAQLVVTDILNIFKGKSLAQFRNLDKLTGHADYKIPMILRELTILQYCKELSKKINQRKEILKNSDMEIEIRANMLLVTNLVYQKLKSKYPDISTFDLYGILWNQSQKINKTPYHLTKTIYY